jgi:S1-C subfamily serine protease
MSSQLAALSNELATVVKQVESSVVAVHARPRFSSSGVVWSPGVIVTAEHTIRREEEITVTLSDGNTVPAALAGADSGTDIAVLRVESASAPKALPHVAAPDPGTLALAIGRSQDSGVNASLGVISARSGEWRTWRGGQLDNYVRLDLNVFPTSDGGAVVNTAGQLIGLATTALSRIAALAIPAVTVARVTEQILTRGHVSRGYLGVGLQPVELPDHHKGLIVLSLEAAGPAAKSGVLIGDIFVALDGRSVGETDDLQTALEAHAPGSTVEAEVLRGGDSRKLTITVGERPRRS